MHGLSKERSGVKEKTDSETWERPPKFGQSAFLWSNTCHACPGRHFVPCETDFGKEKKTAVLQSAVVAKLEIAGTIIYFSLLANKLLNHFEVSNLSFSIFCLSAGGGAAGASLMGAPALLGLLPQGGLIQASKEVGSHHSIKRVE